MITICEKNDILKKMIWENNKKTFVIFYIFTGAFLMKTKLITEQVENDEHKCVSNKFNVKAKLMLLTSLKKKMVNNPFYHD